MSTFVLRRQSLYQTLSTIKLVWGHDITSAVLFHVGHADKMKTSKVQEPCGSGVGEAKDQRPFSGPLESNSLRAGPFSGPPCASCPASLAPGDGHQACFRCLGAEHALVALVTPASCAPCHALPEDGSSPGTLLLSVGGPLRGHRH